MVVCVAHQVFDKNTGSFVRQFGSVGRARGQLQNPYGVAVDGERHATTTAMQQQHSVIHESCGVVAWPLFSLTRLCGVLRPSVPTCSRIVRLRE